jgi:hypothetical protein
MDANTISYFHLLQKIGGWPIALSVLIFESRNYFGQKQREPSDLCVCLTAFLLVWQEPMYGKVLYLVIVSGRMTLLSDFSDGARLISFSSDRLAKRRASLFSLQTFTSLLSYCVATVEQQHEIDFDQRFATCTVVP